MTKVMFNGTEIDLDEEYEKGFEELDLITDEERENALNQKLDDTLEFNNNTNLNDLEKTGHIEEVDNNDR